MALSLALSPDVPADAQALGVGVYAGLETSPAGGAELDRAYLSQRGFEANPGDALAVPADDGSTIVALGLGPPGQLTTEVVRRAAAALVRATWHDRRIATTLLDAAVVGLAPAAAAQAIAEGSVLAAHRFSRYKSHAKVSRLEELVVVGRGAAARKGLERGQLLAGAVTFARDLVNEPAANLTPRRLAEVATDMARDTGLQVRVFDEDEIAEQGLEGLLGVARGSDEPPRLIELVYEPRARPRGSVALVGKGITFDSGGLSLKTAEGMELMKTDKSGAAAVLAAMSVLPALGPPVKVTALVPVTENMPGGSAVKPGDVLRIRNGKTVEVLNTDAEGRLVLADALSLAVEAGVDAIIDVATLTGACVVALGPRIAGLMGNHEGWVDHVRAAAERAGEAVWPLPLPQEYRPTIDSDIADLRNIPTERGGSALTAGLFLQEFVNRVPWAHLDIAGPARSRDNEGYLAKGGTGFGARTLVEAVTSFRKPRPARAPGEEGDTMPPLTED